MKARMSIKNIIFVITVIYLASMFFINICFAANTGTISVETVRLREKANTECKVLELISEGEEVEILSKEDGWYKVKYKKIVGYVREDLIKVKNKPQDAITNVEQPKKEENANTSIEQPKQEENTNQIIEQTKTEQPVNEVKTEENIEKTDIVKAGKYIISENVKFKIIPLINAIELQEQAKNTDIEVIEIINDWVKVKTSDEKTGWIRKEKISTKKAEDTSKVNRKVASTKKVQETSRGASTSRSNTTKVNTPKNTEKNSNVTETKTTEVVATQTSSKGNEIVTYAKQYLGYKYVYGGTTPNGFDCSGFTQYVYKHFGITLNRTAAAQYSNGKSVSNLQAGDLVMFGKSGINHVGIYIGGNSFVHAANKKSGVRIDTLSSGYYKTNYVGARRIF